MLFQPIGSIPKSIEISHVMTIIRKDIFGVSLLKWMRGCRIAKYLSETNHFLLLGRLTTGLSGCK